MFCISSSEEGGDDGVGRACAGVGRACAGVGRADAGTPARLRCARPRDVSASACPRRQRVRLVPRQRRGSSSRTTVLTPMKPRLKDHAQAGAEGPRAARVVGILRIKTVVRAHCRVTCALNATNFPDTASCKSPFAGSS